MAWEFAGGFLKYVVVPSLRARLGACCRLPACQASTPALLLIPPIKHNSMNPTQPPIHPCNT